MPDLTREELIKILAVSERPRLSGTDLSGLDLSGLNFAGADLVRANLSGANLD
ncbi:MAG TPA: pentapeptide repeat-containing protein, partial [Chloroflexi bacterium]|nr:pentapeptide repeat-containing protein [Chloroflexota bacterium]